jgi:dTMP kinase
VVVKEPGSTSLGSELRKLLVERVSGDLVPLTEMLLFQADRSHTHATVILPALKDRSIFGTLAYQGYGGGVPKDLIRSITKETSYGCRTDWSFVLDMPVHEACDRLRRRVGGSRSDPFEGARLEEKETVRQAYLTEARINRDWSSVIDAGLTVDEIAAQIRQKVAGLFASK